MASRVVTLKDVEDGAFLLHQVGEAVASLKGECPPCSGGGGESEACFLGCLKIHQTVKDSFMHMGRYSSNTSVCQALFWALGIHHCLSSGS